MAVRDGTKAAYWRRMIRRQGGSGLSVRAWCGRHHVSEASFYWWRRRLARNGSSALQAGGCETGTPRFVPVRVAVDATGAIASRPTGVVVSHGHASPACIEIILRGRRRVRVFGAVGRKALADVLAVLQAGDAEGVGGANHGVEAEAAAC